MIDKPVTEFTQGQPMAHGDWTCPDKTLPTFTQCQSLDGTSRRIGPIQHPNRFAMLGGFFEHIKQGGDEGVDAAAQILQIDQHDIECAHHLSRGTAHLAIKAEHRDVVDGVSEIFRLHHIVLLVAPYPVLWSKGG